MVIDCGVVDDGPDLRVFGHSGLTPGGTWATADRSQEPLQVFNRQSRVGENVAQRALRHVLACMHRDGSAAPIRVAHHVMTASDPSHLEPGTL
jgi:hypothetical protein